MVNKSVQEERGRIVTVKGGRATVELDPISCCGSCGLCTALAGGKMKIELDAIEGLAAGQTVVVGLTRGTSLVSAFLLFGLPLAGLAAGAAIGQVWPIGRLSANGTSAVLAVVLMAAAFLASLVYDRKVASKTMPRPIILRIERE